MKVGFDEHTNGFSCCNTRKLEKRRLVISLYVTRKFRYQTVV